MTEKKPLRVLFAGSPAIAVPALKALSGFCRDEGIAVLAGLLTNPDSPRGRSSKPQPTECAAALEGSGVPILKPEKLGSAEREIVKSLNPDILVSFAYGKIFGPKFLGLFPLGGINIHPSLLPKYRGPTPIPAAIINMESETGISIQVLAQEIDSGDIFVQEKVPVGERETTESLSAVMAEKAAELLPQVLSGIKSGILQRQRQDPAKASYCRLTEKSDGLIDWNMSAAQIEARIRAYTPWPLCRTMHGDLQLFILEARALPGDGSHDAVPGKVLGSDKNTGILVQTGSGVLAVSALQYRAKKALEWKVFLNGARNFINEKLG